VRGWYVAALHDSRLQLRKCGMQASLESFALLLRAEPALLNEFAQPLLALQAEPCAVTRRWLAGTLPEVVTWSPTLLPACLAVAAALVRVRSARRSDSPCTGLTRRHAGS